MQSQYLNQWWLIFNWNFRNKLQKHCNNFHSQNWVWTCLLQNGGHFVLVKGNMQMYLITTTSGHYDVIFTYTLQWCHNGRDGISNHQPHVCLLNSLFRRRSNKASKFRVTGLCAGNSPGTGEFPAQMTSNVENASIWWRHYDILCVLYYSYGTILMRFDSMMASSNGNNFCVTGHLCWEFTSVVNSPRKGQWRGALMFSFIYALNKRLSKQSWGWWFESHHDDIMMSL